MTAPALPGAAPDPARLPPEVERAIRDYKDAVIRYYTGSTSYGGQSAPAADYMVERGTALRTAIARALGGDGEPVAWAVRSGTGEYDTFRWTAAEAHEEVARLNSDEYGHDIQKVVKRRPFTVAPLYTRPAATGDTGEGERFGGYERERARFDAWWADKSDDYKRASGRGADLSGVAWDAYYARALRAATGGPDAR